MQLRHLRIENFRGIKRLDWTVRSRAVCLIGAGDSGKSTVLTAIDYVLGERWNLPINDADFFGCDVDSDLVIEATVTDVPGDLTTQDRFGLWQRGVASDGSINDDPHEDDEPALTIRLAVDAALEPSWTLVKDAAQQELRFTSANRGSLGVFHLDDGSAHLRWARGSALNHMSATSEVNAMLTAARRTAREAVFATPSPELHAGAVKAGQVAKLIGAAPFRHPRPGLDPTSTTRGAGLVLHDGDVPATQLGAGSQRLSSLAFQLDAMDNHSVVLVDEIELGLEPHRLLHLLRTIKSRSAAGTGQVIYTTHSPITVEAIPVDELHIVRSLDGVVTIDAVPPQLEEVKPGEPQATARSGPSALLARRIVVCEGKTELGVCRALERSWDAGGDSPLALLGVAFRLGGGHEAPIKARCLAELGFPTALLTDDDLVKRDKAAYDSAAEAATNAGVSVLKWAPTFAIEDQLAASLPEAGLQDMINLAVELSEKEQPENQIASGVAAHLPSGTVLAGVDVAGWMTSASVSWAEIRTAIGLAAKKASWFKNEDRGERLGALLVRHLPAVDSADELVATIDALRSFAFGTPPEAAQVPPEAPANDA